MQTHLQRLLILFLVGTTLPHFKEAHIEQQALVDHGIVEVQIELDGPLKQHVPVQFRRHHAVQLLGAGQTPGTGKPLLVKGLDASAAQGTYHRLRRGEKYALQVKEQAPQHNKMYPRPVQPGE